MPMYHDNPRRSEPSRVKMYEITLDNGSNTFSTTKGFTDMHLAVSWAKAFARDWWRDAEYRIFCIDDEKTAEGAAN